MNLGQFRGLFEVFVENGGGGGRPCMLDPRMSYPDYKYRTQFQNAIILKFIQSSPLKKIYSGHAINENKASLVFLDDDFFYCFVFLFKTSRLYNFQ